MASMKVEINVPDSLSEIRLEQYQKFVKLYDGEVTEEFMALKMLEIFCGVKLSDAYNMRFKDVDGITHLLTDLLNEKPQLRRTFKMDGVEYGFIPNLDDMSFGEYIDLDTYLGDWQNIHKAMAVLYRPIKDKHGERYNIVPYEVIDSETMRKMPMDAVLGSVLFFYRLGMDLSKAMIHYLEEQEESRIVQYLNSEESGVGISQYTHSLRAILDDLRISLN
jgi:hypothetical protein